MTLDQLQTFLWIARLGGVRRAAEQMNLSQPAVSGRLAGLESALGVRLFDRTSGAMHLTPAGHRLRVQAERVAFILDEIRAELTAPAALAGPLRLGVAETVAQAWLPDFVARLARAHPGLTLEVTVDISNVLRDALLSGAVDLAVLMGPVSESNIDNLPLPPFRLGWFRAVGRGAVDFATTPVVTYARNTRPHRELAAELMRRHGPGVRLFPSTSLSAAFEMVAADLGVGALPLTLAQPLVREGRIAPFDPGWLPEALRFTASWRADPRDAAAERAAAIAQEAANAHAMIGNSDQF